MNTKLTLKLEEKVIERAKKYAKSRKTSVSKLIENYLQKITEKQQENQDITPVVKSLSGIMEFPKNYNHKKDYSDYLSKKYK